MSVVKAKRGETQYKPYVEAKKLRRDIMDLMLRDFGYKETLVSEYYKSGKKKTLEEYQRDLDKREHEKEFFAWFVASERDYIIDLLRKLEYCIQMGRDITPTVYAEYVERRLWFDRAIANARSLIDELQFIIETLPVDINKYIKYSDQIEDLIETIKKYRRKDNKRYKHLIEGAERGSST
jgi:hypothetical protein